MPKVLFLAQSAVLARVGMQLAPLEPLSEGLLARLPERWAASSELRGIRDANPRRFVAKTAKASLRRFVGRIALKIQSHKLRPRRTATGYLGRDW
jgi:hypothetical protein